MVEFKCTSDSWRLRSHVTTPHHAFTCPKVWHPPPSHVTSRGQSERETLKWKQLLTGAKGPDGERREQNQADHHYCHGLRSTENLRAAPTTPTASMLASKKNIYTSKDVTSVEALEEAEEKADGKHVPLTVMASWSTVRKQFAQSSGGEQQRRLELANPHFRIPLATSAAASAQALPAALSQ